RWGLDAEWSTASDVGDVKMTWEAGRFPQAYYMARAAAFAPEDGRALAASMAAQMRAFVDANPYGRGVHFGSGQEIAIGLLAWVFGLDALCVRHADGVTTAALVQQTLADGARLIAARIAYARIAVRNNHLLSEALGLYAAGALLRGSPGAAEWTAMGRRLLDE